MTSTPCSVRTYLLHFATFLLLPLAVLPSGFASQREASRLGASYIPYSDAGPVLGALREDRLPAELRGKATAEIEVAWSDWVRRRDAAIRARVEEGAADSIVYLLQFGTSFTKQPRISERQLAGVVMRQAGGGASRFVPSPALLSRIEDFIVAVASPGTNTRLQFARDVITRRGIDPGTEAGRSELRRYLQERVERVGQAERLPRLLDPHGDPVDQMTLFRDRGLAPDTSILVDFGVEQTLAALKSAGVLAEGAVRRVAIIGPGLDFTDKQEGYDFYPEQTIQPFAVIDSLTRLGLASARDFRLTAFDLSPRVLQHLEAARTRARAGHAYTLILPRNLDQPWTPTLVQYWGRFGDRIGASMKATAAPLSAGRVDVRGVSIHPSVVLSVFPQDLNIVLQRIEPVSNDDRFDLVLATNLLLYYDVFEQSLAKSNIAQMLARGGVFLSNDRLIALPGAPLTTTGHTTASYLETAGLGDRGDRFEWYRHRLAPQAPQAPQAPEAPQAP